jgi:hypothetical protein
VSSILTDTKKNLGIADDYTAFDQDLILHINGVLSTLNQLGVGPVEGFAISDKTAVWDDFLAGDVRYNAVKTYLYLRVRLIFDPPATSFTIASMERQVQELEWRLNVQHEGTAWVNPLPPVVQDTIYDGGEP